MVVLECFIHLLRLQPLALLSLSCSCVLRRVLFSVHFHSILALHSFGNTMAISNAFQARQNTTTQATSSHFHGHSVRWGENYKNNLTPFRGNIIQRSSFVFFVSILCVLCLFFFSTSSLSSLSSFDFLSITSSSQLCDIFLTVFIKSK